jgi:hypothetical protein
MRFSSANVRLVTTGMVTRLTKARFGNQNRKVASRVPSVTMKNVMPVKARKATATP